MNEQRTSKIYAEHLSTEFIFRENASLEKY